MILALKQWKPKWPKKMQKSSYCSAKVDSPNCGRWMLTILRLLPFLYKVLGFTHCRVLQPVRKPKPTFQRKWQVFSTEAMWNSCQKNQIWIFVRFLPFWLTELDRIGPKWIKSEQNGIIWIKLEQSWTELDKNGITWT